MSISLAATEMARPEPAYALTKTETSKLISAALIPILTPFGEENGKLPGSLTPRRTHSQVPSRLTITTSRMETSTLGSCKSMQTFLSKMQMLRALSRRSTLRKRIIRQRSSELTRRWVTSSSEWEGRCPSPAKNSTGATQEWWWIDWG